MRVVGCAGQAVEHRDGQAAAVLAGLYGHGVEGAVEQNVTRAMELLDEVLKYDVCFALYFSVCPAVANSVTMTLCTALTTWGVGRCG